MKTNKIIFFVLAIVAFGFLACDTIEGDYLEDFGPIEEESDTVKSVLLFEHTGHKCIGCPFGHDVIDELSKRFPYSFNPIGIHAGFFAKTSEPEFTLDFVVDEGTELYTDQGISFQPSGSVNSLNKNDVKGKDSWAGDVVKALQKESEVVLTVEESISLTELSITINGRFDADITGEIFLCVYIVEDSIIAPQTKENVGTINDYVHKHVLRGSMKNGTYGELISTNPTADSEFEKSYKVSVEGLYLQNNDKLHMVPFVYNKDNYNLLPTTIIKKKH